MLEQIAARIQAGQKALDEAYNMLDEYRVIQGAGPVNQASPIPPGLVSDTIAKSQAGADYAVATAKPSGFRLGASSLKELEGVDADLVRCVKYAITITRQDFTVYDGIRSVKEQQTHVNNGTSKTMQSKHLQGLAVDLVPWIGGKPVWDWKGCYLIAHAMDQAATQLGIAHRITWGGAWDRTLADFGGDLGSYEQEVKLYRNRHDGYDFIDGPHFEIRK